MCGISGFKDAKKLLSQVDLKKMTDSLIHRGPDAEGFYFDQDYGLGLGHRRLSIIDLNARSNQPFLSTCGRYVCVYNGEIYNFRDIAIHHQLSLKTSSDTEVLTEGFAKIGKAIVPELNGMFAFAIWDKQEKELFLARDPLGKKPLYFHNQNGLFAFASELKALLSIDLINENKKLNDRALTDFLHLGYIPEPHSAFENIEKFPAGNYGVFKNNELEITPFWKAEDQIEKETKNDFISARNQFKNLLEEAVERRLVSDVPFGTFLSGGVDSSLVTAVAAKMYGSKLKTFTVGFTEARYNEAAHAKEIATYLGTDHHEYVLHEKDSVQLLETLLDVYDEPYADSSAVPSLMICEAARKNVTMILSGDGGDELFHGYGAYNWANRLNHPLIKTFRYPVSYFLSKRDNRSKRAASVFRYQRGQSVEAHIFSQEQYLFSNNEISDLIGKHFHPFHPQIHFDGLARKLQPAEKQALFDIMFYLKDDLLVKTDRAGMYHSLEIRTPMLDHKIVNFALNLDPKFKIQDGKLKYFLRQTLFDYIPEKYFHRPKQGFAVPLVKWLKGDLRYLISDYLNEKTVTELGYVSYPEVKSLLQRFDAGEDYLYNRIWLIITLHKFLLKHV